MAQRQREDPPPAPWGSFPLSELVIFLAIVLIGLGFFFSPTRGAVMIGVGLGLGALAGLEVAIREHFAGYRSHTMLLAGAAAMAVLVALVLLGPDRIATPLALGIGLAVFGLAAGLLLSAFKKRAGGAAFKVR